MNKKNVLKEIKNLLKFSTDIDEDKKSFTETKSGDLIVRVEGEEFSEEAELLVVTEEGVIPAEDGTYKLEDEGIILTVVNGTIEEVEEFEKDEDEKDEDKEENSEDENFEDEDKKDEDEDKKDEDFQDEKVKELFERVDKVESLLEEILNSTKDVAEFSSIVNQKIDSFVKNTPAEMEFNSIKSQHNKSLHFKKEKMVSNLESIRSVRSKK